MSRMLPKNLKVDRSALSVASLTDGSDEKAYWLMRTPQERLKSGGNIAQNQLWISSYPTTSKSS